MTSATSEPTAPKALTVLLGPEGPLVGVRDVLADWVCAGLIDGFAWTHPAAAIRGEPLAYITTDGPRAVNLDDLLTRQRPDIVRLLVLHPRWEGAPGGASEVTAGARALAALAEGGRTRIVRAHVHIARGQAPKQAPAAYEGWHNLLVSPEDSYEPGDRSALLAADGDAVDIGLHAATSVAAVGGLFRGVPESPLDTAIVPRGSQILVLRSYVRILDAEGIEATLRDHVTSLHDGYPGVLATGMPTVPAPDPGAAAQRMADQLWSRHRHLLGSARATPQAVAPRVIGAWAALRYLFSFLWAALRNAPGAWWRSVMTHNKARTAGWVDSFVFGPEESAYEVVVKGITASGAPRDWQRTLAALQELDDGIAAAGAGGSQEAPIDLAPLWRDYVDGALTLMDGQHRSQALVPVSVGERVGVLTKPEFCVPASSHSFTGTPPNLAGAVTGPAVDVADVLAAGALAGELRDLTDDPRRATDADSTLSKLQAWGARQRTSYATCVTRQLARAFLDLHQEIRAHARIIEEACAKPTVDQHTRAFQEKLARIMRWLIAGLAVIWVLVGALWYFEALAPNTAARVAAGGTGIWFVAALVTFLNNQRELFQRLNAREHAMSQLEAAQTNLAAAIRDARHVGDAYALAMTWTKILGAFLESPLGRPRAARARRETMRVTEPLALLLGTAQSDPRTLARYAAEARVRAYPPGWTTLAWNAFLRSATDSLIDAGLAPLEGAELFHQRHTEHDRHLGSWAQILQESGFESDMEANVWQRALGYLTTHGDDIITGVQSAREIGPRPTPGDLLTPPDTSGVEQVLAPQTFSPGALVEGRHRVRSQWIRERSLGLGGFVVLVQQTDGLEPDALTGNRRRQEAVHAVTAPSDLPDEDTEVTF